MRWKIKDKSKVLILIFISILIILIFVYGFIFQRHLARSNFAKENMKIYEENKDTVFKLERILLCNSANAVDLKENGNFNVYQYTDIAIYIDNGEELSNKNTIKELYIDNISLEGNDKLGIRNLNYKNLLNYGLKQTIVQKETPENISFNIVYTNEQDAEANYDEPTFYTDCSNPISLEYQNYNLVENYQLEENNQVQFDGSILEKAGIKVEDIDCKIKFKINIVNNENEKYTCYVNFKIPLNDIYSGTTTKAKIANENEYIFFKE